MPELIATVSMPDVHCVECGEGLEVNWNGEHPVDDDAIFECPVCGTEVEIITRVKVDYTIWRTKLP